MHVTLCIRAVGLVWSQLVSKPPGLLVQKHVGGERRRSIYLIDLTDPISPSHLLPGSQARLNFSSLP